MKSPTIFYCFPPLFVSEIVYTFGLVLQQTTIVCLLKIVKTELYPSVSYCFEKVKQKDIFKKRLRNCLYCTKMKLKCKCQLIQNSFLFKQIQKLYFLRHLGIHLDVFCVGAINRELYSPSRGRHPNLCADLFVH